MCGTLNDEASNEQTTTEKNEGIKLQSFAKSFAQIIIPKANIIQIIH
jgi:hypothetical protein